MKAPRNNGVTASYLVLRRGGDVLLMRRANTGYEDGNYQVPAGHIDAGEVPTDAIIREAKEEIGVVVRSEDLKFVHTMFRTKHDPTGDRIDYYFEATTWEGEPHNTEPEKCDDVQWFSIHELPENITYPNKVAFAHILNNSVFSELGEEELRKAGHWKL